MLADNVIRLNWEESLLYHCYVLYCVTKIVIYATCVSAWVSREGVIKYYLLTYLLTYHLLASCECHWKSPFSWHDDADSTRKTNKEPFVPIEANWYYCNNMSCLFILERIQHKQADSVEKRARLASVVSAVSIAPNWYLAHSLLKPVLQY